MKYYVAHKGRRIGNPMSKEEAIMQLFQLKGAFNDLSILIYDDEDKLRGKIDRKKPPNEP